VQLNVFASAAAMGGLQMAPVLKSEQPDKPFDCPVLHPIAARSIDLLNSLPKHAHFRKVLIATLLRDFKPDEAAKLAGGVSESEVEAAFRQYSEKDIGELAQAYATHTHKHKIPDLEIPLPQQHRGTVNSISFAVCLSALSSR
jgi:hypothetical protein